MHVHIILIHLHNWMLSLNLVQEHRNNRCCFKLFSIQIPAASTYQEPSTYQGFKLSQQHFRAHGYHIISYRTIYSAHIF